MKLTSPPLHKKFWYRRIVPNYLGKIKCSILLLYLHTKNKNQDHLRDKYKMYNLINKNQMCFISYDKNVFFYIEKKKYHR